MKRKYKINSTANYITSNENCDNSYSYIVEAETQLDAEGIAKLRVLEDFCLDLNSDKPFQFMGIKIDSCDEIL